MSANIVFGAPQRNCLGQGICQIFPDHPSVFHQKCNAPLTKAVLFKAPGAKIGMLICRSNLLPQVLNQQLSGTSFQMEEAFILPAFLSKNLGLPQKTTLASGAHEIQRSALFFVIHFPYY